MSTSLAANEKDGHPTEDKVAEIISAKSKTFSNTTKYNF